MISLDDIISRKIAFTLLIACTISVILAMPAMLIIQGEILALIPLPLELLLLLSILQNILLFSILIYLGMKLSRKTGFKIPILENRFSEGKIELLFRRHATIAFLSGMMVGLLILGFDLIFVNMVENIELLKSYPGEPTPELWKMLLALPYGAIAEEIALRFFCMTAFVWIFSKIRKSSDSDIEKGAIWIAIVIAAILFGASHLPTALYFIGFSPFPILRIVFLNTLGGIVFGWLYWKYGLEYAMISHLGMDIVLHILLIPVI